MLRSAARRQSTTSQPNPTIDRGRIRIVVVDDDPNAFPIDALRAEGYSIEHWEKVHSLQRLEKGEFDIIILDIGGVASHLSDQADQDGMAILEHLKSHNPRQVVVAFSGQRFDLGKKRFWDMADDCVQKPVDALKAKEVLDQLIAKRLSPNTRWKQFIDMVFRMGKWLFKKYLSG